MSFSFSSSVSITSRLTTMLPGTYPGTGGPTGPQPPPTISSASVKLIPEFICDAPGLVNFPGTMSPSTGAYPRSLKQIKHENA